MCVFGAARVCTPGHSDVSFLISGRARRSGKAAEGGCQEEEEEASNALCADKALDAATSAGIARGRGNGVELT